MMNPYITFEVSTDDKGQPVLMASLNRNSVAEGDTRLKYAQLAMSYATQVAQRGPFGVSTVSAGDKTKATLTFTQAYTEGEYDDFGELISARQSVKNSIGCSLSVDGLSGPRDERPFGWAASPAVAAATTVHKMVERAIHIAAGISMDGPEESPSL
jgi:hypothetical protein